MCKAKPRDGSNLGSQLASRATVFVYSLCVACSFGGGGSGRERDIGAAGGLSLEMEIRRQQLIDCPGRGCDRPKAELGSVTGATL